MARRAAARSTGAGALVEDEAELSHLETASEDDDDAGSCLFCHGPADEAYVPVHLLPPDTSWGAGLAGLFSGGRGVWAAEEEDLDDERMEHGLQASANHAAAALTAPLVGLSLSCPTGAGEAGTASCGARQRRRQLAPGLPYTANLAGHRGCGTCWMRWEAERIGSAAEAGRSPDLAVRCPVCDCAVDIRRAYDGVLCEPCQSAVVARGGKVGLAIARARSQCFHLRRALGVLCLCALFAIQLFFSIAVWELCEQQIQSTAEARAAARAGQGNPVANPFLDPMADVGDPSFMIGVGKSGAHGSQGGAVENVTLNISLQTVAQRLQ